MNKVYIEQSQAMELVPVLMASIYTV